MVRKYWAPWIVGTRYPPQMSTCKRWKAIGEEMELEEKGRRVCLASGQTKHGSEVLL